MAIEVVRGQTMTLLLEIFQGEDTGPRTDITGATLSIADTNLNTMTPILAITDAVNGELTVTLGPEDTSIMSLTRPTWFQVRVTLPSTEVIVVPKIELQGKL